MDRGASWERDDGILRGRQDVTHRLQRQVTDIDQDAKAVTFTYDLFAEFTQVVV